MLYQKHYLTLIISLKENNYNLSNLNSSSYIAVQAHVYYEDLINEIIEKTNNIPVKFDLLITTTSLNKSKIIEKYLKNIQFPTIMR